MSAQGGSAVGMMDPAYFVGKRILLEWINTLLKLNLKKIEETCTGAIACQILQSVFPGKVPMSKVDFGARHDYEYIKNYKVLQNSFDKLKISKHIPVDKLVRGKYQDNLEFMQWFKSFYDLKGGAAEDYNAEKARSRSRNAPKGVVCTTSNASRTTSARAATKKRATAPKKAIIKETTKENSTTSGQINKSSTGTGEGAKLREANEKLVRQVGSMQMELDALRAAAEAKAKEEEGDAEIKMAMDGLEKERDFYFKKLRDIEVYLQERGDANGLEGEVKEVTEKVFAILYATDDDDDFAPPEPTPEKSAMGSPSRLPTSTSGTVVDSEVIDPETETY